MPRPRSETGPREQRPGGKESTSYRLTPEARGLVATLATRLGIPQSSVIELAVRELAERKGAV